MRMRNQLETRLGQVIPADTRQKQLCIRGVPAECTPEMVG